MVILTGDVHGDGEAFFDILEFCERLGTTKKDIFVILGDVGINYYLDDKDDATKEWLETFPVTFFFVRGNHEERPENIPTYEEAHIEGGRVTDVSGRAPKKAPDVPGNALDEADQNSSVPAIPVEADIEGDFFVEPKYPSLLFADNGLYKIEGKSVYVVNGAYSVDKWYRIGMDLPWFEDEELFDWEEEKILKDIDGLGRVDCVFTHTCPEKFIPTHALLPEYDQSKISRKVEKFLDKVEEKLDYERWYCGHYHIDEIDGPLRFVFNDYVDVFNEGYE